MLLAVLLACLCGGQVAAAEPGPAECRLEGTTLHIRALASAVEIVRDGDAILADGADCAGATVDNVDLVDVRGQSSPTKARVSLRGGPFAPGATDDATDASDEISFSLDGRTPGAEPSHCTIQLEIVGADTAERIGVVRGGIDLTGDGDADAHGGAPVTIDGRGGDDEITAGWFAAGCGDRGFQLVGGEGDDDLTGADWSDKLQGGPGDDHLVGGDGADVLRGGPGADELVASMPGGIAAGEVDRLAGGPGPDRLVGDLPSYAPANDVASFDDSLGPVDASLAAGRASDDGSSSIDELVSIGALVGSHYPDHLVGDDEANELFGTGGDDTIEGGGGDDKLSGGLGADILRGGTGADLLEDTSGANRLFGDAGDDKLRDGPGAESFDGGAGAHDLVSFERTTSGVEVDLTRGSVAFADGRPTESIQGVEDAEGTDETDTLIGDAGANRLDAKSDVGLIRDGDTVRGGPGDDKLSGRDASADYSQAPGPIVVRGPAATDGEGGHDLLDTPSLRGTAFGDDIERSSHLGTTEGMAGNDRIVATSEAFTGHVVDGGPGADHIQTGPGNDLIRGGPGADELAGGEGSDSLDFRHVTGTVVMRLDLGTVPSDGEGAADVVTDVEGAVGSPGPDTLVGGAGAGRILGLEGNDVIRGGPGDDWLLGGVGDDVLDGGAGRDRADYGSGLRHIPSTASPIDPSGASVGVRLDLAAGVAENDGRGGRDTLADIEDVEGSDRSDVLEGDSGPNTIRGAEYGDDVIRGRGGDDHLGEGENRFSGSFVLEGGPGDDVLSGARIPAVMRGGAGADELVGSFYGTHYADYSDAPTGIVVTAGTIEDGFGTFDRLSGYVDFFRISGSPHADVIDARGGVLRWFNGAGGPDELIGSEGGDVLFGGPGPDVVKGGDGRDELTGGPGTDLVFGDGGDDKLRLVDDELDTATCGEGSDQVRADERDVLVDECESVQRETPPPPPTDTGGGDPAPADPPASTVPSSPPPAPLSPPLGAPSGSGAVRGASGQDAPVSLRVVRSSRVGLLVVSAGERVTAAVRARRCVRVAGDRCGRLKYVWTSRAKRIDGEVLFRVPSRVARRHGLRYYVTYTDARRRVTVVRSPAPRRAARRG